MSSHVQASPRDNSVANHVPTPLPPRTERDNVATQNHDNNASSQPNTSLRETCADIHNRVTRFLSTPPESEVVKGTQEQTRIAISVIDQALQDYSFDALSLSYNGGKDCLVLLVLYLAVLHTHFTQPSGRRKQDSSNIVDDDFPTSIPSIYAKPPDPFDSVSSFVDSSTRDYHLDLTHISTNPGSKPNASSHSSPPTTSHSQLAAATAIATLTNGDVPATSAEPRPIISFRDAFALYLHTHPNVKAIFVGTRRTDPHGASLKHFQMTDGNWPVFMRIHPVIDWRLSEIWCFLRSEQLANPRTGEKLEYCRMYDAGYTSLGGIGDTLRNPKLRYIDDNGNERYRPAYEMTEDVEERAGRE